MGSDTLPMNKMIAMTISAGATTAAVRLITPEKLGPSSPRRRPPGRGRTSRDFGEQPAPFLVRVVKVGDASGDFCS